jgi:hypothetical protein
MKHPLRICVTTCIDMHVSLFFILEVRDPQGTVRHVAASEPILVGRWGSEPEDTWQCKSPPQLGDEVQSQRTRGSAGAHLSQEVWPKAAGHVAAPEPTSVESVRSGVTGHVVAPETTSAGRRGSESEDMWQCRSPPQLRGEVRSHGTCGSTGAHLSRQTRSRVAGHVVAREPNWTGRRGQKPYDTWQHRSPPWQGGEI